MNALAADAGTCRCMRTGIGRLSSRSMSRCLTSFAINFTATPSVRQCLRLSGSTRKTGQMWHAVSLCRKPLAEAARWLSCSSQGIKVNLETDVYFHSTVSDPGCIAVAEVVMVERLYTGVVAGAYSVGWAALPLYSVNPLCVSLSQRGTGGSFVSLQAASSGHFTGGCGLTVSPVLLSCSTKVVGRRASRYWRLAG